jgi:hypothetical protein
MADREGFEADKIAVNVGRVEWSAFAFSATTMCRTRVAFVLVLEVAAKTEPDLGGATAATELVVDVGPGADAEEKVYAEKVVEAEETGVGVAVVDEAVKAFEAARTIPLKSTPEIVPEGGVMPVVDVEVLDVDQTLGVEAGDGTKNRAVKERVVGVFQMGSQVGFLYVC